VVVLTWRSTLQSTTVSAHSIADGSSFDGTPDWPGALGSGSGSAAAPFDFDFDTDADADADADSDEHDSSVS
jgi:hypothetical protein